MDDNVTLKLAAVTTVFFEKLEVMGMNIPGNSTIILALIRSNRSVTAERDKINLPTDNPKQKVEHHPQGKAIFF